LDEAFVVYYWVVNYDEILDEAFVVYYWVVNYDETLIQKLSFWSIVQL
jgi:hypothetical protein